MRYVALVLPLCLVLVGCSSDPGSTSTCEVFSSSMPASPSDQNAERVEMQASGDPIPEREPVRCRELP
ncbi:hypothetical protein D3C76_1091000 [compost metagenome]